VLRAPELDAGLQVGSDQSGAEGQNPLARPAGHAAFGAAQNTVGLLGCEHTLLGHVQLFIPKYSQVLFSRAALHPFIPQPVLILGIALIHVQDIALDLVECHEVHMGQLLELVQVPLDGILSLRCVNRAAKESFRLSSSPVNLKPVKKRSLLTSVCQIQQVSVNRTAWNRKITELEI